MTYEVTMARLAAGLFPFRDPNPYTAEKEEKTMKKTYVQIATNLYLNRVDVEQKAPTKPAPANVNHIAIIDCSGSMYGELPRIREQLKKRLPHLMKEGDTLSIIWFSGRGEFGTLLTAEPVATLKDLKAVNESIDRWLKPIGLTGFKQPIELVSGLVENIRTKNKNPFALFFMSDGCDNQWSRNEILGAVANLKKDVASAVFVEYGYYADRNMLSAMAEQAGGTHVFAQTFDSYEPTFEKAMQQEVLGAPKLDVYVSDTDVVGGFAWSIDAQKEALPTYALEGGRVLVSPDVRSVYFLTTMPVNGGESMGPRLNDAQNAALYAAISLFSVRMQPKVIYPLLKYSGDVALIKLFGACFGKQRYTEFMDIARHAVFTPANRLTLGYDPSAVPADDAFTVFDFLKLLEKDSKTKLLLDDDAFEYSRIGRRQVDADENFSAAEQKQLAELQEKMAKAKDPQAIAAIQADLNALLAKKREALKFEAKPAPDGYDLASLTYNEESPNISVLVKKEGRVDLTKRKQEENSKTTVDDSSPKGVPAKVPDVMDTFIYRNYSIVAHGLINVKKLPLVVSDATFKRLVDEKVPFSSGQGNRITVDLDTLPILNRNMVKDVSAKEAIELQFKLEKLRAQAKVYKDYVKTKFPGDKLVGFTALYGEDGANWLKEQGIIEYSGFNPKKVQAESTDFINGKELKIKIKGFSTLPPVAKVKEKMDKIAKGDKKAKLNGPETLMAEAIKEVEEFLNDNPSKLHKTWLTGKEKTAIADARALSFRLSQIVFSIVVGQTWFVEWSTLDQNEMDVNIPGFGDIHACVELEEVQIKV